MDKKRTAFMSAIMVTGLLLLVRCAHLKDARDSYNSQKYEKTIQLCQQAVSQDSTDAEAWYLMGQSRLALKENDQGLDNILRAYDLNPQLSGIGATLVSIYLDQGDEWLKDHPRKALKSYKRAGKIAPENPEVILKIADYYFSNGQLDAAEKQYQRLLAQTADSSHAQARLSAIGEKREQADQFFVKGVAAYKKSHFITAQTNFKKALKFKPDNKEAKYYLYLSLGRSQFKKGSQSALWDALENYGKATVLFPKRAEIYYWMGKAYEKKDSSEYVNAIDSYQKALELEPDGPLAAACQKKVSALTAKKKKMDKFWGKTK